MFVWGDQRPAYREQVNREEVIYAPLRRRVPSAGGTA